ncbi:hypothetical protein AB0L75_41440, partial [Streptomyces sp. NPDC052101]
MVLLGNAAAAQAGTGTPVPGTPTPTASGLPQSTSPAPQLPASPTPTLSAGPSAEPPTADTQVPAPDADWTAEAAISFWTPERMAAATDPSGRTTAPPKGLTAAVRQRSASAITAQHFNGIKSVGTIFTTDRGMKGHNCTASVVRSGGHNLILTAGHCVGRNAMFVPMYDQTRTAAQQQYGVWAVDEWFRDKQYASDLSKNSDL